MENAQRDNEDSSLRLGASVVNERRLPDYLPARMANEFVYCPRLFFYEWVDGVFRESVDTVEGKFQHQRVDAKTTKLPKPEEAGAGEKIHSSSVTLSSEKYRVITKIDLIEGVAAVDSRLRGNDVVVEGVTPVDSRLRGNDVAVEGVTPVDSRLRGNDKATEGVAPTFRSARDGSSKPEGADLNVGVTAQDAGASCSGDFTSPSAIHPISRSPDLPIATFLVTPVDYKHGHPRETPEGLELWPSDRTQLAVQGLVLRENGYRCQEGIVYYAETRQRVRVIFDEALMQETEAVIAQAWALARSGEIPPPLADSPKCPGCSLVGICLPDETNTLRGVASGEWAAGSSELDAVQLSLFPGVTLGFSPGITALNVAVASSDGDSARAGVDLNRQSTIANPGSAN